MFSEIITNEVVVMIRKGGGTTYAIVQSRDLSWDLGGVDNLGVWNWLTAMQLSHFYSVLEGIALRLYMNVWKRIFCKEMALRRLESFGTKSLDVKNTFFRHCLVNTW